VRIFVNGLFGGQIAVALTKAAVVDREDRESEITQQLEPMDLVGQICA